MKGSFRRRSTGSLGDRGLLLGGGIRTPGESGANLISCCDLRLAAGEHGEHEGALSAEANRRPRLANSTRVTGDFHGEGLIALIILMGQQRMRKHEVLSSCGGRSKQKRAGQSMAKSSVAMPKLAEERLLVPHPLLHHGEATASKFGCAPVNI